MLVSWAAGSNYLPGCMAVNQSILLPKMGENMELAAVMASASIFVSFLSAYRHLEVIIVLLAVCMVKLHSSWRS